MALHDPDEDRRRGLFGRIAQGVKDTGRQIASGAGLLDRAMRFVGENPLDFLPVSAEGRSLGEARQAFSEGRPGAGLLGVAGAFPIGGRAVRPAARAIRGLFSGLEELKGTGFRIFARSEGPGARTVASITPNPKKPGSVKVSLFEETAQEGASDVPVNTLDFDSVDEAAEALSGGRPALSGFSEVPLGTERSMELVFERGLMREAGQKARESGGDPGLLRAVVEGNRTGFGGFFNP